MSSDSRSQLSHTTVVLHWLVGVAVIAMLALGIYMEETENFALYPWHKSFGVIIFFIAAARVIWRLRAGWPEPVGNYPNHELMLAKAVHWVLLLGTVLMPLSGFLMSSLGGTGVSVFGLEIVARNPDPENPRQVIAHNEALAGFFHSMHGIVALMLIVGILLHIAGAMKHHVVDKDGTLRRIFGARIR